MHGDDDDMGPLDADGLAAGIADSIFGADVPAAPEPAPQPDFTDLSGEQQAWLDRIDNGYPTPADMPGDK